MMTTTYFETLASAVAKCPDSSGILGDDEWDFPSSDHWSNYWCAPRNAVSFAAMGVDGVHYAILKVQGEICDESPVIQISPMDSDEPYCVLGATLLDYLAVACNDSHSNMAALFERERSGEDVLVSYMKQNFNSSRLFENERIQSLIRYLSFVEVTDAK